MSDMEMLAILAAYIAEPDLCKQIGVTRRTLARWDELGIGPVPTVIGRKKFYSRQNIDRWLAERERTKTSRRMRKIRIGTRKAARTARSAA